MVGDYVRADLYARLPKAKYVSFTNRFRVHLDPFPSAISARSSTNEKPLCTVRTVCLFTCSISTVQISNENIRMRYTVVQMVGQRMSN